jgi:hypothetical protein
MNYDIDAMVLDAVTQPTYNDDDTDDDIDDDLETPQSVPVSESSISNRSRPLIDYRPRQPLSVPAKTVDEDEDTEVSRRVNWRWVLIAAVVLAFPVGRWLFGSSGPYVDQQTRVHGDVPYFRDLSSVGQYAKLRKTSAIKADARGDKIPVGAKVTVVDVAGDLVSVKASDAVIDNYSELLRVLDAQKDGREVWVYWPDLQ